MVIRTRNEYAGYTGTDKRLIRHRNIVGTCEQNQRKNNASGDRVAKYGVRLLCKFNKFFVIK